MNEEITPSRLKEWRKMEGLNQEQLAQMVGWDKLIVSNIETGRRNISDPEQRLLKLLIYGEMPFETKRGPWNPQIEFTDTEWSIMTRVAHREGYHSPRAWIVQKIRDCLAMRREYPEQQLRVAEEQGRYQSPKPNNDIPDAG